MVWPLLTTFFETHLHASIAFVGVIEGSADGVSALLKYYAGRWSDRAARRKPLVLAGYGLSSLVRPLMAFVVTPWTALAIRVVDRVGKGIRSAPRDAMLAGEAAPEHRAAAFGFHRALDNAGAVIGPLAAAAILWFRPDDLRTVFLASAVPGALAVTVIVLFVRERQITAAVSTDRASHATAPDAAGERETLRPELRAYLSVLGLFALANASDLFLLAKAHDVGIPTRALPLVWAGLSLLRALVTIPGGRLADRIGRARALRLGWIVYAAAYVALAFARSREAVLACVLLYSLYYGLCEGAERALVASFAHGRGLGRAYGLYALVSGAGATVASLLFAGLYRFASSRTAFVVSGSLALGAALLLPRENDTAEH